MAGSPPAGRSRNQPAPRNIPTPTCPHPTTSCPPSPPYSLLPNPYPPSLAALRRNHLRLPAAPLNLADGHSHRRVPALSPAVREHQGGNRAPRRTQFVLSLQRPVRVSPH